VALWFGAWAKFANEKSSFYVGFDYATIDVFCNKLITRQLLSA
jgi:hypothetical protein